MALAESHGRRRGSRLLLWDGLALRWPGLAGRARVARTLGRTGMAASCVAAQCCGAAATFVARGLAGRSLGCGRAREGWFARGSSRTLHGGSSGGESGRRPLVRVPGRSAFARSEAARRRDAMALLVAGVVLLGNAPAKRPASANNSVRAGVSADSHGLVLDWRARGGEKSWKKCYANNLKFILI